MKTTTKPRSGSAASATHATHATHATRATHAAHATHGTHAAHATHAELVSPTRSGPEPTFNAPAVTQQMLDVTRTQWVSSIGMLENCLQFVEEAQLIRVQAMEDMRNNLNAALHEAEAVRDIEGLMSLPVQLSTQQFHQMASRFTSLSSRMWEAQSQFLERAQAQAARLGSQWVQSSVVGPSGESYRQAMDESAHFRSTLFGNAQSAWANIAKQWVESGKQATEHVRKEADHVRKETAHVLKETAEAI